MLLVPRSTGPLKATKSAKGLDNFYKFIDFDRPVTVVGLSYHCGDIYTRLYNWRIENLRGSNCYWAVGFNNVSRHGYLLSTLESPFFCFLVYLLSA